jgi:hypothetical protein
MAVKNGLGKRLSVIVRSSSFLTWTVVGRGRLSLPDQRATLSQALFSEFSEHSDAKPWHM